MTNEGCAAARRLYHEFGLRGPQDFSVEELINARNIFYSEKPLAHADGRIVPRGSRVMIILNSDIPYAGRRRFTQAHELGHFELRHYLKGTLEDTALTLDYYQHGNQEYEANQFATELLMPGDLFREFVKDKPFSPDLLRTAADYFQTSITSVTFRYLEQGPHPLYLFYSRNGNLLYFKQSPGYWLKVKDLTRLSVPTDSVAMEYYRDGTIYSREESAQEIVKSTWFETQGWDDRHLFYEFAIVTKAYDTVLSVVWSP